MRLFLVLVVLATPSAASAAGAWLTGTDSDLQSTGAVRGLALGGDGRGYAVTWDESTRFARVVEVEHTLTGGPTFVWRETFLSGNPPMLAYDGTTALFAGATSSEVLVGTWGNPLSHEVIGAGSGQTVSTVAIERTGSQLALLGLNNGGFFENAARADPVSAGFTAITVFDVGVNITSAALFGNTGIVLDGFQVYRSGDVRSNSWVQQGAGPIELGIAAHGTANAFGEFVFVGPGGAFLHFDDDQAAVDNCPAGGEDLTAVTSLEGDFWLGRGDGTVEAVNVGVGCTRNVTEASRGTGLDSVDGLAALDARQVLALGQRVLAGGMSFAWRNRPPLTPIITAGGGAVDDETPASATASANDPDLDVTADDPPSYAWTCDPLLDATNTNAATVNVATPSLCVDADVQDTRTDLKCTVTTTDSDGQQSPTAEVTFSVLPVDTAAPAVAGVVDLANGAAVLTGTLLTLNPDASDDCLHQATWTVRDQATGTVREQRAPDDWNLPFAFVAATLGSDEVTSYTLELTVTDTAGNVGALAPFTFMVALPQPPVEVDLTCPATLEAGALGTATAAPRSGSGTVLDYTWMLGGAAATADATPTDATFTFQTDACDGGDRALLRMVPHGIFEDGAQRSCAIDLLDPASPAPPALVVAEAPVLPIALGEDGFAASLQPSVTACASHDVTVRWDLSGLPAALRPPGTDDAGELALGRTASLALAAGPEQFASLEGTEAMVRAVAVDARTGLSSTPVEVTLRFFADAAFIAAAGVDVRLVAIGAGAVDDGELVSVRGTITTDVAPALPGLTVALAGDGLAPVPGSVVIDSDCGARATVAQQGDRAVLTLEGVSAGCPAAIQLVARRGFGGGGLIAQGCAFGATQTPLSRCQGGLTLDAPAALSCAAGATPPLGVLALVLFLATRRSSTCARRQG